MEAKRLSDMTLEQLRLLIREEIQRTSREEHELQYIDGDLSDFPVDQWGSWPEHLSLRREDMYGDEGR
ncbi:hypothetical protein PLCT1_00087 [Planctomycetaceae bacterium]|nr:hypothetical protein PLCT1_00087 [Planctomycetaceae bacterium]